MDAESEWRVRPPVSMIMWQVAMLPSPRHQLRRSSGAFGSPRASFGWLTPSYPSSSPTHGLCRSHDSPPPIPAALAWFPARGDGGWEISCHPLMYFTYWNIVCVQSVVLFFFKKTWHSSISYHFLSYTHTVSIYQSLKPKPDVCFELNPRHTLTKKTGIQCGIRTHTHLYIYMYALCIHTYLSGTLIRKIVLVRHHENCTTHSSARADGASQVVMLILSPGAVIIFLWN